MIVRIYVLGPLDTHGDLEENKRDALAVGQRIVKLGGVAIVPHLFNLDVGNLQPRSWWLKADLGLLSICHAAMVRVGWQESEGSVMEMSHCFQFGIQVFHNSVRADWGSLELFIREWQKRIDPHEGGAIPFGCRRI